MQIEDILKAAIQDAGLESNLEILNSANNNEFSFFTSPASTSSTSSYSNYTQIANSPQSNKDLNNNDQDLLLSDLDFSILSDPSANVLTPSSSELSSSSVSPVSIQQDNLSNCNLMLTDDDDPFLLALKQLDEQNSKLEASDTKTAQSLQQSQTFQQNETKTKHSNLNPEPIQNTNIQNRKIIKINSNSLNSNTNNLISYSAYKQNILTSSSTTATTTITTKNQQPIVRLVSINNKREEPKATNDLNNLINFRNNLNTVKVVSNPNANATTATPNNNTTDNTIMNKNTSQQVACPKSTSNLVNKTNNPVKIINLSQLQQKQLQERLISTNVCQRIIKIQNSSIETSAQQQSQQMQQTTTNQLLQSQVKSIAKIEAPSTTSLSQSTSTTSQPIQSTSNGNNIKITKVVSSKPSFINYSNSSSANVIYYNKTNNQLVPLNPNNITNTTVSTIQNNKKFTTTTAQSNSFSNTKLGNQGHIITKTTNIGSNLTTKTNTIPKFYTATTTSKTFTTTQYINNNSNNSANFLNKKTNNSSINHNNNSNNNNNNNNNINNNNNNTHLNVLNSNISRYASQNNLNQAQPSTMPINPKYLFNINNSNISSTNLNNQNNSNQINGSSNNTMNHQQQNNTNKECIFYEPDEEVVVEEEEELGHAETYANYMPSKLQLGLRHPDPIVETSSLASVEPPDIWYNLRMPESIYSNGALSALQLEAVVYASQKHEEFLPNNHRCGFLIGDGAGVGKGRTIAGIIYENYLLGRKKALWLSVSNDLKYDAQRDFSDIGAHKIHVHALNKLKYNKISSKQNSKIKKGVIFSTYSSLIGESQQKSEKKKYSSRLKQLLQWLGGESFDGVIVFDECHKAKNLVPVGSAKPTKTGLAVLELQEKLPNARIVYASATGASEPKNMAYMVRLGLWGTGTPFNDFNDFIQSIEKRGVGAMEIVAMDMKLRGMYMARQLSFSGVTFKVEEIPLKHQYIKMYDDAVKLWVNMKEKFQEALDLIDQDGKLKKTVWGQFWSSHQRFFKYLCMACKVPFVVDLAKKALINKKCVVIGLQSTGEARTLEHIDEGGEINEFVSTARGVLQNLVEKHFPCNENFPSNSSSQNQKSSSQRSKNSQKVNDIFQRLSSYTNKTTNSLATSNKKNNRFKKAIKNRSSSISSTSSIESSTGSIDSTKLSDLNDDNEDLFDSEFDNESDLESDFSLTSLENQNDLDDFFFNDNKNTTDNTQSIKNHNDLDIFNIDFKIDQNDSGISLNTTKSVTASKRESVESDDSDSLFSITKSVSIQALINKNNQETRKKQLLSNEERKKRLREKKRKKLQQLNLYQNENEEDDEDDNLNDDLNNNLNDNNEQTINRNKIESDSDDDFKLPTKRLKNDLDESNNNESKMDLDDPFGFSISTSSYEPIQRPKPTKPHEIGEYIFEMKSDLLNAIRQLGRRLPANTLDELIDLLDGPEHVAEMTGRKGRIVSKAIQSGNNDNDGNQQQSNFVYETRSETDVPLELMNVVQKEKFMNGEKLIAIISEAASSGISLQANRRYDNQYRRVHITIELPWSADRAIQQFGRTHRSNQVSAPEYIFVISQLAGEKRFASTVAKRLESLGALTHGDRRATESRDLSRFNIDNKYGRAALENVIKSICNIEKPMARIPKNYKGDFMKDAREALHGVGMIVSNKNGSAYPEKDYNNINKFLNRLLGCPVLLQNAIFNFFSDILAAVILQAKRTGKWDMGILDLGSNNEIAYRKETKFYMLNNSSENSRRVEMHTVLVERGMTWEKALEIYKQNCDKDNQNSDTGFYISTQVKNNHRIAILAVSSDTSISGIEDSVKSKLSNLALSIYRPNTGLQVKLETPDSLLKKYKKVTPTEAKSHWNEQYQKSATECTHVYRQGHCTNLRNCEIGLRTRKFYILAGSVLTVWTKVENVLCHLTGSSQFRLQIIRVKTNDNYKIVGCVIPTMCLKQVDSLLGSMSSKTYIHNHLNNSNNSTNPIILDDESENTGLEKQNKNYIQNQISKTNINNKVANNNINNANNTNNEKFLNNNININNNNNDNDNSKNNDQYLNFDFT